jgi:hypothetical protein
LSLDKLSYIKREARAVHGVVRWRACDLIMRLYEEFGISVSDDTVYRALKDFGFSHVSARPKAYKQDTDAMEAFKKTFPPAWQRSARSLRPAPDRGVMPGRDAGWPEEQADLSIGQEGLTPRAAHDQRNQSTYLFGAVCPERGAGAALVLPACNSEAMQLHLDEIATKVAPGAHAIVLLDQAGWHGAKALKVPSNLSLMPLPPRTPELNGQENVWQFMRQNWLSNRVFKSFDDIVDHCCYAWNTLIDQPWKIMSIARRDWASVGYSM